MNDTGSMVSWSGKFKLFYVHLSMKMDYWSL